MTLLALLVSRDDSACEVLARTLPAFGLTVERIADFPAAIDRLQQQRFDALVIDFEDAKAGADVYAEACRLHAGTAPITVALVAERAGTRDILSGGAHFVLYKPLSDENAKAGLRPVASLLKRERRGAQRVPMQAPVEISLPDGGKAPGIILDLSEAGMDVLTADPQIPGLVLDLHFQVPDGKTEARTSGQVAWANPNGQSGIRFLDLDEPTRAQLRAWLHAAARYSSAPEEPGDPCRLTDLSLGGCYVETESPFPEQALVNLCLKVDAESVYIEGMVRVTHPGHGMGVEFPSRTAEQRAQVGNLIGLLQSSPESTPQMSVSPSALRADPSQFRHEQAADSATEELNDPLLELLRRGSGLQQEGFLAELRRQRSGESVNT